MSYDQLSCTWIIIIITMVGFNKIVVLQINIQDASLESFLALLEYLYTDHVPIEKGDSVEIMLLADRFCLPRLVTLCELYITKKVDRAVQKKVADGTSDVINLLLTSQVQRFK